MQRQTRLEINIGGKVRPLLFDFTFLDYQEEFASQSELAAIPEHRLARIIVLCAIKSGADFEGQKPDKKELDLKTVGNWILEMPDDDGLLRIMEAYKTAMGFIVSRLSGQPVAESPAQ